MHIFRSWVLLKFVFENFALINKSYKQTTEPCRLDINKSLEKSTAAFKVQQPRKSLVFVCL